MPNALATLALFRPRKVPDLYDFAPLENYSVHPLLRAQSSSFSFLPHFPFCHEKTKYTHEADSFAGTAHSPGNVKSFPHILKSSRCEYSDDNKTGVVFERSVWRSASGFPLTALIKVVYRTCSYSTKST